MLRPSRVCSGGCKAPVWSWRNLEAHCPLGGCHSSLQTQQQRWEGAPHTEEDGEGAQEGGRLKRAVFSMFSPPPMCARTHTHRHARDTHEHTHSWHRSWEVGTHSSFAAHGEVVASPCLGLSVPDRQIQDQDLRPCLERPRSLVTYPTVNSRGAGTGRPPPG